MAKYAEKTQVSAEKSRVEIEKILSKYGATSFMYGWQDNKALLAFEMMGRRIKFVLPLPNKEDREITHKPNGWQKRTLKQIEVAYEQAVRQRWRAFTLVIKAKLEAVESGITEFEEEFLAHIVLPNGSTIGQFMIPQIDETYRLGKMPPLLGGPQH